MTLVYDAYPDRAYEPDGFRPHSTRPQPHGGFAGHNDIPRVAPASNGFGNVRPMRMLEGNPPLKHPWLTPDLAYQELAIGAYQEDRVQVALDSVHAT